MLRWRRLVWHTRRRFYRIDDGNPHLRSPSLESSSVIRPGDTKNPSPFFLKKKSKRRKKMRRNVAIILHHHDGVTPPPLKGRSQESHVWMCALSWWGHKKKTHTPSRSTGVVAARLKMNEKAFLFFCLCRSNTAPSNQPRPAPRRRPPFSVIFTG